MMFRDLTTDDLENVSGGRREIPHVMCSNSHDGRIDCRNVSRSELGSEVFATGTINPTVTFGAQFALTQQVNALVSANNAAILAQTAGALANQGFLTPPGIPNASFIGPPSPIVPQNSGFSEILRDDNIRIPQHF